MLLVPQECYLGTDFYLPIIWTFEVCNVQYPIDLTGYEVEMQVGYDIFTPNCDPVIDVTSQAGQITVDGPNGKINICVPNSLTQDLYPECYDYGVKVTNTLGQVERLFGGTFEIRSW